jgi:hypothetical protein
MLMLVLTWVGIAIGTTLLLLMALGPVIVEMDGWFSHRRRAKATVPTPATKVAPVPVLHG